MVNSYFPPWRGGAESCVYNLAKNLSRRGHEVVVYCGAEPLAPGTRLIEGVRVERLGILCKVYGTPVMPSLTARLLRESADIMHANFPSPLGAFQTGVVSKLKSTPTVLTWHNDLPPRHADGRRARCDARPVRSSVLPALFRQNHRHFQDIRGYFA